MKRATLRSVASSQSSFPWCFLPQVSSPRCSLVSKSPATASAGNFICQNLSSLSLLTSMAEGLGLTGPEGWPSLALFVKGGTTIGGRSLEIRAFLTIILDHLPRHLSPTPHKLLGLLSSQSVVTALIQGNRRFKIVIGEF